jgi:hypothetical protein
MDSGGPIRAAMRECGSTLPDLSKRTRELDPHGQGISVALAGFAVCTGGSARETISVRAGDLIAAALGRQPDELFVAETQVMRQVPTSEWGPA